MFISRLFDFLENRCKKLQVTEIKKLQMLRYENIVLFLCIPPLKTF